MDTAQSGRGVSILGDNQNLPGHGPGQTVLGDCLPYPLADCIFYETEGR